VPVKYLWNVLRPAMHSFVLSVVTAATYFSYLNCPSSDRYYQKFGKLNYPFLALNIIISMREAFLNFRLQP